MDGERVVTNKGYELDDNGKRYLSRRELVIQETGEVLQKDFYGPGSRRPIYSHVNRPFLLS